MWVRNTASRRVKSSPAETNADGDPRPQSTTNTRPSTTTADEIPPRPATGSGAPAVPSKTSSVATEQSPHALAGARRTPPSRCCPPAHRAVRPRGRYHSTTELIIP